jgi:hypothetical protein
VDEYEVLAGKYEEALQLRKTLTDEGRELDEAIASAYRAQDEIIQSLQSAPPIPAETSA